MAELRLIDANALRNVFDAMHAIPGGSHIDHLILLGIKNFIDEAPSIDAVPVVRCFECANRGDKRKCPMCFDESDGIDFYQVDNTDDDGFCHYGERKEVRKDE